MSKRSGPGKMPVVIAVASIALGLAPTVGVSRAFASDNDPIQAPRGQHRGRADRVDPR